MASFIAAWLGGGEYLHAWERLLLPVAREWAPALVIVSAGFDAARYDGWLGILTVADPKTKRNPAHTRHQFVPILCATIAAFLQRCLSTLLSDGLEGYI